MVTNLPVNTATGTLLEAKNLNVDYLAASGTVHAVTDVSFSLRRGEILGLAGESGSGKSTLAYAITRLLRPPAMITSGEIRYYPREDGDQSVSVDAISRDAVGKGMTGANAIGADAINRVPTEVNGLSIDILNL